MKFKQWINEKTKIIKIRIKMLYFALTDESCPWFAKAWGSVVLIYALSPIDLIPDFIPIIGYLDDLILLPFGIWLFTLFVGKQRWSLYEGRATNEQIKFQKRWYYAIPIIIIWSFILGLILYLIFY